MKMTAPPVGGMTMAKGSVSGDSETGRVSPAVAAAVISPVKLAHMVLRTSRFGEMIAWYKGEPEQELKKRPRAGARGLSDIKLR
jgi:hypothetical protein